MKGIIMWKVGVVGCGNIAKVHAEVLKNMDNVSIRAFADCKPDRAAAYKEIYGTQETNCWSSLEEMLENEELDVVHICTPHYLHVPMALKVLEHGVHVFMEKPPAISRETFQQLMEAEKTSGKHVGICFQNRYNESVTQIFEELKSGEMGNITGARAFLTWSRDLEYYKESGWRGVKKTEGGGVLMNQAIHTLDLIVQFMGNPLTAEASMKNHHLVGEIEEEDTMEAYIRFEKASACLYATNAYITDSPVLIELECENGSIRMEENQLWIRYKNGTGKTFSFAKASGVGKSYWGNSHGRCITDYYESMYAGKEFRNSLENVKDTFSLTMDLYESAATGKPVVCGKEV